MQTQACTLTIKTTVDGQESELVREGILTTEAAGYALEYSEEAARITIRLSEKRAEVRRTGDYELYLPLEKGRGVGRIGLGDSSGEIPLTTRLVGYGYADGTLTIILRYDLGFGAEKQKMCLQITASVTEEK